MLDWIVATSLRYRLAVIVCAAVMLVVGVFIAMRSPLDVFPEFAPPMVEIQTEAEGMSSEAVESLVTIPIESAVNGVPRMAAMRSKSVQGLSSVQLIFDQGVDVLRARQMVTERVAVVAPTLPERGRNPRVLPPLSSTSRILKVGLTSDKLTPTELSIIAEWTLEPRLRAVPGVANISIYGLKRRQYQVQVRPEVLREHGLSLAEIKLAARQAVTHGSAGYLDTPNQRLAFQYTSPVDTATDLRRAVVAHRNGQSILLGQVATLTTGNPPPIGEGVIGKGDYDKVGPLLVIEKYPDANTLEVTRKLEEVLETMRPGLPDVEMATRIFRPATFIEQALVNLRSAMILGCILVALILIAFLFEWRTAVISLTAIPLSLVAAVVLLRWLGGSINTMVLAGLAIAIGEVVDDAIIDVENIIRRLKLEAVSPQPRSSFRVVLEASLEVRSAVVYASLIVAFVCLPIFFMGGVAGAFFQPLALAYILAILSSLIVALTVTPAMSLWLLPKVAAKHAEPALVRIIKSAYVPVLAAVQRSPRMVFGATLASALGAALLYPRLKEEYLPQFQETDFLMHWIAKPGTGLDFMEKDIIAVSKELRTETRVKELGAHIARAEIGEEVVGTNFAEIWVSVDDASNYKEMRKQIEAVTDRHAGIEHDLLTYLQERIKEVLSGAGAAVVLRTYGPDSAKLREQAERIRQAIDGPGGKDRVPGVVDLRVESQVLVPQLELKLDPDKLASHGLTPTGVLDTLTTLVNGAKVGEVHRDQKSFDVVVVGHPELRASIRDLGQLEIDLPAASGTVRLNELGEVRRVNAPNVIRHDKASRCIDVLCNVSGGDLGGVVSAIQARLATVPMEGYRTEILGEYQARRDNQRNLYLLSALSILGIAMLLYIDFRSMRLMLLTLFTLPFALIGGVYAAWLFGGILSLGSLVGFVTVLGIAARNGIMLVSHYRHLQLEEGVPFGPELILRGARERVAPILMTALAAGLGLLPLAIGGNQPGYEIEYPMAIVILGGLMSSTLLNLLVVPLVYARFGYVAKEEGEEEPGTK